MEDGFFIDAYKAYRENLHNNNFKLKILPFHTIKGIEQPKDAQMYIWIYEEFISDYSRQIVSEINDFRDKIIKLNSWNNTLSKYDLNEKFELLREFINPIATLLHDYPFAINNRFIFSLTNICHQANMHIDNECEDDLPEEDDIGFNTMKKYCSKWKNFDKFLLVFDYLPTKDYLAETDEYRHRFHHRMPIHTEIGLSNFTIREVNNDKSVSYLMGSIEPISLDKTIDIMKQQHLIMCECFFEYEKLLNLQIDILNKKTMQYKK